MAIFEIEANGKTFEIDAPDQGSAVTAFKAFSGGAPSQPSMAEDVAKSAGSGLVRGLTGLAGLPGDAASLVGNIADRAAPYVTTGINRALGTQFDESPLNLPNRAAEAIGANSINRGVDAATGLPITSYKPQTIAGEYARTAGEFAPGAIAPGGIASKVIGGVLVPAAVSETAGQLTKGTDYEGAARLGGALAGGLAPALIPRRLPAAPASPVVEAADAAGVNLTAAQRTGDPALFAAEDAMLGGARGSQAQVIAQRARDAQEAQVRAARDNIGKQAGEAADGTQVLLDRPGDAGGIVGQRVRDVAGQAEAGLAARNAALQAERDALFRGAENASESMGARFNPQGFNPVDAGGSVAAATRSAADRAKSGYQQAYRETFAREGQIDPEFFTGVNKPGSQSVMASGSAVNEFAAPVSTRVKERLLSLDEPIIPDATVTPLASKTLDELDRVAALRLGRIGNPTPGQEITGVNLRGIEQARKIITSRINAAKNNPQAGEDLRALRGIAKSFDDELERGFDSALFKGDSSVLDAMKGARGEFARYQQTFKQRARGDDAGAAIQKIVERNATPEEVSNYVLGSSRVGDNGLSVRLYGRLKEMLGTNSPQFQQIRGAAWEKLTAGADAATPAGATKIAQGIQEFATGRGSTLAKQMFSADELASMQRYGNALRSFSAMAKSPVAKVEAEGAIKTLIDVAGQRMSPENMASALFGHGNKVTNAQNRLVDAVANVVGKDGPEWAAIKQGQWQRLTGVADGKMEMGPQKMSQRIHEFVNGEGRSMAEKLYTPGELAEMRKFAAIQRARVAPPGTTNPSNSGNRLAGLARQSGAAVTAMLGAQAAGPVGAGLAYGAAKTLEGVANLRAASQARKLFSGEEPARRALPLFDPAQIGSMALTTRAAAEPRP